jgi:hypothetical protein
MQNWAIYLENLETNEPARIIQKLGLCSKVYAETQLLLLQATMLPHISLRLVSY